MKSSTLSAQGMMTAFGELMRRLMAERRVSLRRLAKIVNCEAHETRGHRQTLLWRACPITTSTPGDVTAMIANPFLCDQHR